MHFEECGSLDVSSNFQHKSGFRLGSWVEKIRKKKSELSSEQIAMLDAIGFVWESVEPFNEYFELAQEHFKTYGHLPLEPKQCKSDEDLKICRWLRRRLIKKNAGILSDEKILRLTAIGMDWMNANERAWTRDFPERESIT